MWVSVCSISFDKFFPYRYYCHSAQFGTSTNSNNKSSTEWGRVDIRIYKKPKLNWQLLRFRSAEQMHSTFEVTNLGQFISYIKFIYRFGLRSVPLNPHKLDRIGGVQLWSDRQIRSMHVQSITDEVIDTMNLTETLESVKTLRILD